MADYGNTKLRPFNPDDVDACAEEWESYKRQFRIHLNSRGLHEAPGRRKVGQLLEHMGEKHVDTYDTFTWEPAVVAVEADQENGIVAVAACPAEDENNLDDVFKKFDAQFGVHKF